MRQKWLATTLAAGLILAAPSAVWSQIAGRVQDGSGNAISGATVEAWDSYPDGTILLSGSSNAQGAFSLGAIGPATFDLRVWRNDDLGGGVFQASHFPVVVRNLPEPISNTTVRLTAVPDYFYNPLSYCDYSDGGTTFLTDLIVPGDVIEIESVGGELCGVTRTNSAGSWLGHAYGDDPSTPLVDEGPDPGEVLAFRINGLAATVVNAPVTFSGSFGCSKLADIVGATSASGITLTGPTAENGSAGSSAFITYSITNTGNIAGNFTVSIELDPAWNVIIQSVAGLGLNLEPAEIEIPEGTPNQDVEVRAKVSSDTYGPANSGAWTTLTVETVSDIGDGGHGLLPNSFALAQNYPNPFNAGTNITFGLDKSGQVSLSVCNLLGQRVRTLIDGHREAGIYTEAWDGRDENGNPVSSGIYFSRLLQNGRSDIRKMVLLK